MLTFGALCTAALALALLTRDWRLKTMATACFAVWAVSTLYVGPMAHSPAWLDPVYTAFLFLLAFGIQARGEVERQRGEPLAMWLLVFMGVEAVIAVAYVLPSSVLSPLPELLLIQTGFAAELVCLILVGGRRLGLWRKVTRALTGGSTARRDGALARAGR